MTQPLPISFSATEVFRIESCTGKIALFMEENVNSDEITTRIDARMGGALTRLAQSVQFKESKVGECQVLAFPGGLLVDSVIVAKLPADADAMACRKAGAALASYKNKADFSVLATNQTNAHEIAFGLALRAYDFDTHKTKKSDPCGTVTFFVEDASATAKISKSHAALTEGVFFTRDLVNEPANILTTDDFAARLAAMQELGLEVEILEEAELAKLGMGALLGVGQGSPSPSKVVVMRWQNGGKEAPLALIGKGVVFDTGGISIKPAAGMEEMTMDMGGAAVVAGVMRTLALRKAKANVVGMVGIVENMPDGLAQRPGDVVKSMKGDTIEVINTDAEGRLVLADVMWYAQERFEPCGMIDLATLTGAIIIGLGHEMAGVFSNNDDLCDKFLASAIAEGEGAWRMPVDPAYDKALKSRVADVMNVGGRPGGAITAAMFLQRFVKPEMPWIHLDIAGVALVNSDTDFAPKGATGWGVRSLDHLIREHFED